MTPLELHDVAGKGKPFPLAHTWTVSVMGARGVGKTTLCHHMTHQRTPATGLTFGTDLHQRLCYVHGQPTRALLFDVSGDTRRRGPLLHRPQVNLFVYDCASDVTAAELLSTWVPMAEHAGLCDLHHKSERSGPTMHLGADGRRAPESSDDREASVRPPSAMIVLVGGKVDTIAPNERQRSHDGVLIDGSPCVGGTWDGQQLHDAFISGRRPSPPIELYHSTDAVRTAEDFAAEHGLPHFLVCGKNGPAVEALFQAVLFEAARRYRVGLPLLRGGVRLPLTPAGCIIPGAQALNNAFS